MLDYFCPVAKETCNSTCIFYNNNLTDNKIAICIKLFKLFVTSLTSQVTSEVP